MDDPSYEMQRAIRAALVADTGLQALIGSGAAARVWDRPPDKPAFPYITIGDDQALGEDVQWTADTTYHANVHVWSRATDRGEMKQIGGLARSALTGALTPNGHRVIYAKFVSAVWKEEPDGLTYHAILSFEFRTQPTS